MPDPVKDFSINYIELFAPSVAEARRFYGAAFGWTFEDFGPDYASFADGRVGGGFNAARPGASGAPLVILYAANLEDALARVERAGGTIVKPIFSFPGGRRFQFTDPAGNELAVWSDQ